MNSDAKRFEKIIDEHKNYLASICDGIVQGVRDGTKEGATEGSKKAVWDALKKECLPQGLMNVESVDIENITALISKSAISRDIIKATSNIIESSVQRSLDELSHGIVNKFQGQKPNLAFVVELITQRQEKIGQWIQEALPNNPLSSSIVGGVQTALDEVMDKTIQGFRTKIQERLEGRIKGGQEKPQEATQEWKPERIREDIKTLITGTVTKVGEEVVYNIIKQITIRTIGNLRKELNEKSIHALEQALEKTTKQQLEKDLIKSINLLKDEVVKDCADKTSFVDNINRSFGSSFRNYILSLLRRPRFSFGKMLLVGVGILATAGIIYTLVANKPPEAMASVEQTQGLTVSFSSEGSYDPDPDGYIKSYHWDFGDGLTSAEPNPEHTYDDGGHYITVLTVTDAEGAEEQSSVTVLLNKLPVAVALIDWTNGLATAFIGEDSYDPEGGALSYYWDFGDGATSAEASPEHTYSSEGTYEIVLTVIDIEGAEEQSAVTVLLNKLPVLVALIDWTQGLTVSFSSEGSYVPPVGNSVHYHWDFGDGSTSAVPNPEHTYDDGGHYITVLTVTDVVGTEEQSSVAVLLNELPVAVALVEWTENLEVGFSSEGSYDPEGGALSYYWDFGDGATSAEASPEHTYSSEGTYEIVLTVIDIEGAEGWYKDTIIILRYMPPNLLD